MENLKLKSKAILEDAEKLMKEIEDYNLVNEQWVLSWLDSLNALSVKH